MRTCTAGTVSFPGPTMHRTPSGRPPWDSRPSSAYSATNLLCFPGQENPQMFQLWTTGFRVSERFGLSQCPPPAGSAETQGLHRCPSVACPRLSPRRSGLALNPGSASPPALPEAESPLHRSLHHWEADKWGHLPPSTPSPISYSPCIPHLTSQALLSFSPRHRRTISTTSFRSSRGTLHLPSTRDLGLPLTGQPLEISDWLGGLQAGGKILGGLGWFSGSLSFQRFPSQPPRPARTQRPWPAPSPSWGVRSHPWRKGYCQGVTVTSVTTNYTQQIQFTWLLILPVFRSQISTAPVLHRLQAPLLPLVPLDKVKDWLLTDKTL